MPTSWTDYIDAAHRKISIAEFHLEQLNALLNLEQAPFNKRPSIPVQAHFEGVVVATGAAIDQVAQATNSAWRLRLDPSDLLKDAFSEIEKSIPEFVRWREQPIGRDLRILRRKMVHYSYSKSSNGKPTWQVETMDKNYNGPRDLSGYAKAVIAYAQELGTLSRRLEPLFREPREN